MTQYEYQKFTQKALMVVMLAQEEALRLGHKECGAENILTALSATGHSSEILKSVGLSHKQLRSTVRRLTSKASSTSLRDSITRFFRKSGVVQLNEQSRQIFEFVSEFRKNEKSIDTHHLLLGIIELDGGITKQIFSENKVDLESLKARLHAFNG
ncbi:MAG: Clp protease N-terminal domain-containing protein [Candidatus Obscuribacterales bacterium]|nr:Clp protease N-terminal domain-containing protein [Candidatus Obscuribacterales bacterium]